MAAYIGEARHGEQAERVMDMASADPNGLLRIGISERGGSIPPFTTTYIYHHKLVNIDKFSTSRYVSIAVYLPSLLWATGKAQRTQHTLNGAFDV